MSTTMLILTLVFVTLFVFGLIFMGVRESRLRRLLASREGEIEELQTLLNVSANATDISIEGDEETDIHFSIHDDLQSDWSN